MHRWSFAALLLLAQCTTQRSAPPPPKPAEVTPAAVASATVVPPPPPVASSAAAPAPPPRRFPTPATPPRANPERVLLASSICAAAYTADGSVGCRSHPPFDAPENQPDGKLLLHTGDPLTFCGIDAVFHGAFTKPGANQAVVSFAQCKENDPNATWDSGFPGSAVLVEQIDGTWTAIAYEGGVNTNACQKSHRRDGRDVLLCASNFSAGSIGTMSYFFLLDFAQAGSPRAKTLASLFSNVELFRCFDPDGAEPVAPSGLVGLRVEKVSLGDVNGDGTPDLIIDVERARAAPSAPFDSRVRALCKKNGAFNLLLPRATTTKLVLASDGDGFRATPASRALLDAWEKELPDVVQLQGAAPTKASD